MAADQQGGALGIALGHGVDNGAVLVPDPCG